MAVFTVGLAKQCEASGRNSDQIVGTVAEIAVRSAQRWLVLMQCAPTRSGCATCLTVVSRVKLMVKRHLTFNNILRRIAKRNRA